MKADAREAAASLLAGVQALGTGAALRTAARRSVPGEVRDRALVTVQGVIVDVEYGYTPGEEGQASPVAVHVLSSRDDVLDLLNLDALRTVTLDARRVAVGRRDCREELLRSH